MNVKTESGENNFDGKLASPYSPDIPSFPPDYKQLTCIPCDTFIKAWMAGVYHTLKSVTRQEIDP